MWRCIPWLVLCCVLSVNAKNCRGEEPRERECESICDSDGKCVIRAALLLPKSTTYDASLSVVEPVFELALQDTTIREALPSWLSLEWKTYDVTDCDAAYAIISAIDAYTYDCAHVFFGPACDFALASVARIAKFLGSTGTPMLTTGGFTFDFVQPKLTCDDEFYMLARTGMVGFKDVAYFLINLMRHYDWRQLLLITEPDAQLHVAGKSTCHLMMKTFANFLKTEELIYTPWDTTSEGGLNYTENLKFYLGNKYTSKFSSAVIVFIFVICECVSSSKYEYIAAPSTTRRFEWGRVVLLYESQAFNEIVGVSGGFLLASTIHDYFIFESFNVMGREIFPNLNFEDVLLQTVGNSYASKLV